MKGVGEVMAIGRTFEETIQKALRTVDVSCCGFAAGHFDLELSRRGLEAGVEAVAGELRQPLPTRLWTVAKGFR